MEVHYWYWSWHWFELCLVFFEEPLTWKSTWWAHALGSERSGQWGSKEGKHHHNEGQTEHQRDNAWEEMCYILQNISVTSVSLSVLTTAQWWIYVHISFKTNRQQLYWIKGSTKVYYYWYNNINFTISMEYHLIPTTSQHHWVLLWWSGENVFVPVTGTHLMGLIC